jgi:large-conductance mechanosensitive channel
LHLLSCPPGCVFWKVLDVVDSIVEAILYTVVKVLDTADLLTGPTSGVLGEIGDVIAEFIEAVFNTVLIAFKVVLYTTPYQYCSFVTLHGIHTDVFTLVH